MANTSVYLETSFISYLTARPSRDLVVAAYQQITRDWWQDQRDRYELFVSQVVIDEAALGDQNAATRRLEAIEGLPLLDVSPQATALGQRLIAEKAVPEKYPLDALHVGVAAVNGMDYVLTWNFKHLANAGMRTVIQRVCIEQGYRPPVICTPEELSGDSNHVE